MLELGDGSVSFEPDSRPNTSGTCTSNFFDCSTSRICTMRNNGGLGITCKSLNPESNTMCRIKDRGPSTMMKLSPNGSLAVLQRQPTSIDVILMLTKSETSIASEFNVPAKSREPIIDVEWITNNQLLLVTKQNMELVNINEEKRTFKLHRSTNISAAWSVYYGKSNLVIAATGANSATLQPVVIHHGQFTRLKSFDVDFGVPAIKENILEKDVFVASIYGHIYVMVLKRYAARSDLASTTDLAMFQLSSEPNTATRLKYTLSLGCSGGFGIHVIDNLIIVHHQLSARSMIFDVALAPNRPTHSALVTTSICANPSIQSQPELYTITWSIFQPDIIADGLAGVMYRLKFRPELAAADIADECTLIEFLMHRSDQSSLVVNYLSEAIRHKKITLRQVRKLFNILADKFTASQIPVLVPAEPTKSQIIVEPVNYLRIEQMQMHSGVFIPLKEDCSTDKKYVANVMLQYLRSLHKAGITVEAYFLELLVEALAEAGEMAKLHQLVTYRVISDSKPLAFLLLCYEARCPLLFQSGVDILARQRSVDEIVEVLLEKGFVVDAVRFLESQPSGDGAAAKLLEAAVDKGDRVVQYAVVSHLRGKKHSRESLIASLYTESEVSTAEREVAICELYS